MDSKTTEESIKSWIDSYVPKEKIGISDPDIEFGNGIGRYQFVNKEALSKLPIKTNNVRLFVDGDQKLRGVYFARSRDVGICFLYQGDVEYIKMYMGVADQKGRFLLRVK